jgi:hypothetical protein
MKPIKFIRVKLKDVPRLDKISQKCKTDKEARKEIKKLLTKK